MRFYGRLPHDSRTRGGGFNGGLGLRLAAASSAVAVGLAGCGAGDGAVSRSDAIQNVISAVDAGPSWETQAMSEGVSGYLDFQESNNGNDGGGGCAFVNGTNANRGFACYLEASATNGSVETYFIEKATVPT